MYNVIRVRVDKTVWCSMCCCIRKRSVHNPRPSLIRDAAAIATVATSLQRASARARARVCIATDVNVIEIVVETAKDRISSETSHLALPLLFRFFFFVFFVQSRFYPITSNDPAGTEMMTLNRSR